VCQSWALKNLYIIYLQGFPFSVSLLRAAYFRILPLLLAYRWHTLWLTEFALFMTIIVRPKPTRDVQKFYYTLEWGIGEG
jgi:hypothetical protein